MCHTKMVNQVQGGSQQGMTGVSANAATYGMYQVSNDSVMPKPVMVDVQVNEVTVPMQVDTGATCSVMSRTMYEPMFGQVGFSQEKPNLCAYGGVPLSVVGQVDVKVRYGA